jgi:hypothetical protein
MTHVNSVTITLDDLKRFMDYERRKASLERNTFNSVIFNHK